MKLYTIRLFGKNNINTNYGIYTNLKKAQADLKKFESSRVLKDGEKYMIDYIEPNKLIVRKEL